VHHPSIQVLFAEAANSKRAGVAVCSCRRALNRPPVDVLGQMVTGDDAAIPLGSVLVETDLIGFRRVDPFEASFGFADR
jgi:hypothetical protein